MEAKLGIFSHDKKKSLLENQTNFDIKKTQQNNLKKINKTVNLLSMAAIFFFNLWINTPSKQFAWLENKFFKYFLPFFLNSYLKRTYIYMGCFIYFVFSNIPSSVIKVIKALMETIKNPIIPKIIFAWFQLKQIIDSSSFLFLLTHIELYEKMLE